MIDVVYRNGEKVEEFRIWRGSYEDFVENVYINARRHNKTALEMITWLLADRGPSIVALLADAGKTLEDVIQDIPNTFSYKYDHRNNTEVDALQAKWTAFKQAASELNKAWERVDYEDSLQIGIEAKYPFHRDFMEMVALMQEWGEMDED